VISPLGQSAVVGGADSETVHLALGRKRLYSSCARLVLSLRATLTWLALKRKELPTGIGQRMSRLHQHHRWTETSGLVLA